MINNTSASRLAIILLSCVLAACLIGCDMRPNATRHQVPVQQVPSPPGLYSSVTWLSPRMLIVQFEADFDRLKRTNRLSRVDLDQNDLQMLSLPEDEERCRLSAFEVHRALWDGRLGYVRRCWERESETGFDSMIGHLFAWDSGTEQVTMLRDYDVGHAVTFTFSPDSSRGLVAQDSGIEDQMFWLGREALVPLDVGMARAYRPAWSPDGDAIIFWGNRTMRGKRGPGWAWQPYDLWLMPAGCQDDGDCADRLQRLEADISEPSVTEWSPDGRWLVFLGAPRLRTQGIWLREMETGKLIQVARGQYRTPKWSPDGTQLVVIGPPPGQKQLEISQNGSTLYLLDVSEIVGE